jgi:nucleotide-binding universal stress UspA family protein
MGRPTILLAVDGSQPAERAESIVMGTRGLGAMAGLVLGSVAMKVVQLARIPVTLVK